MNTKLVICLSFIIDSNASFSQEQVYSTHSSQIIIEYLGPGGKLSFQFESRFKKETNGIGYTVGFGSAPYDLEENCNDGGSITIPVGLNYLVGRNHMLEIGGGTVLKIIAGGTMVRCLEPEDNFFENDNSVYFYSLIGYRYQPAFKRLSGRIFASPLFQKDFSPKFWGGASIGWRLKRAK